MNYSEVKELLSAGFTHDEIVNLFNNNPQNPQVFQQAQETAPDPTPEPEPVPAEPEANPETAASAADDARFNQLNATMEKLIKTIQTSNLRTATYDKPQSADLNTQVDAIMSSIIRPEKKGD